MIRHEMKLRPLPFLQIRDGEKTIEARLYDEKRRLVQLGDEIRFINTDTDEAFVTSVEGLLCYANFRHMFAQQGAVRFGFRGDDVEAAAEAMRKYYSEADEANYGVLGIEIRLL